MWVDLNNIEVQTSPKKTAVKCCFFNLTKKSQKISCFLYKNKYIWLSNKFLGYTFIDPADEDER